MIRNLLLCAALSLGASLPALTSEMVKDPVTKNDIFVTTTYEPPFEKNRQYPVLMVFHGGEEHTSVQDGSEKGVATFMRDDAVRLGYEDDILIIAPHSPGRGWRWDVKEPEVQAQLKAYTAWMFAAYPMIDRRRVLYIGWSNGGASAGPIAVNQPELYAGMSPWTGGPEAEFAKVDPNRFPDFYMVAASGEGPGWKTQIHGRLDALMDAKVSVLYHEPVKTDHGTVSQRVDVRDDCFRWLMAVRSKSLPLPKADQVFIDRILKRKQVTADRAELLELDRIGGIAAGAVLERIFAGTSGQAKMDAAALCTRTIFGDAIIPPLLASARKERDPPVVEKLFAALGVQALWRREGTLTGLCMMAADKSLPPETRGRSILAIEKAISLDIGGGIAPEFPERHVIVAESIALWTLVQCLADKSPALAAAAQAALAKHDVDLTGYDAKAKPEARAAAVARIQTWMQKRYGKPPL